MSAYFIVELDIHDTAAMQPYLDGARATVLAHGGQSIANATPINLGEEEPPKSKVVILKFDSMEQAQAWYQSPEYQALLPHRLQAATNRAYLVEGV